MEHERRKYPRYIIDQPITLCINEETLIEARGINLSKCGLYCETATLLEPETPIELIMEITLHKKQKTLNCHGTIIRSGNKGAKYYAAIAFECVEQETKKLLKQFIEQISQS